MKIAIIILAVIAVFFIIFLIMFYRWRYYIRKVWFMSKGEKVRKINELAQKWGYYYEPAQDILVSRVDAWQHNWGYEQRYDQAAARFNMVFDCVPIYFDYGGKSWLIEFWKGQYGINIGSEIGVYNVSYVVPKEERKNTHYECVSEEEQLDMAFILYRNEKREYIWSQNHWWLAAFKMGHYDEPSALRLRLRLVFPNVDMAMAFVDGLKESGYAMAGLEQNCTWVTVDFRIGKPISNHILYCLRSRFSQWQNRCFVKIYRFITNPFVRTDDRLLFLYYQLPFCLRKMLRIRSYGRKHRNKKKKGRC